MPTRAKIWLSLTAAAGAGIAVGTLVMALPGLWRLLVIPFWMGLSLLFWIVVSAATFADDEFRKLLEQYWKNGCECGTEISLCELCRRTLYALWPAGNPPEDK